MAGLLLNGDGEAHPQYLSQAAAATTLVTVGGFKWQPMFGVSAESVKLHGWKKKAILAGAACETRKTLKTTGEFGKKYDKFYADVKFLFPGLCGRGKFYTGTKSKAIVDEDVTTAAIYCRCWDRAERGRHPQRPDVVAEEQSGLSGVHCGCWGHLRRRHAGGVGERAPGVRAQGAARAGGRFGALAVRQGGHARVKSAALPQRGAEQLGGSAPRCSKHERRTDRLVLHPDWIPTRSSPLLE